MISDDSVPEMLIVGRITTVFGVRGWLKVFSYTEDIEALLDYQPWWIDTASGPAVPEGLSLISTS